jgi:predicted DNA binding protein
METNWRVPHAASDHLQKAERKLLRAAMDEIGPER